jgi:hypothetical protein
MNTNFNNIIINYIALTLSFITFILLIIRTLDFIFVLFINYDDSTLSCKEILSKSQSIIKHNKWKYLIDKSNKVLNINMCLEVWDYKIISEEKLIKYITSLLKSV